MLDSEEDRQSLFKILMSADKKLSQIFRDLCEAKKEELMEDFSFYEPSLHHMFIALSSQEDKK